MAEPVRQILVQEQDYQIDLVTALAVPMNCELTRCSLPRR